MNNQEKSEKAKKIIKDYKSLEILGVTLEVGFQLVQLTCLVAVTYGDFLAIHGDFKNPFRNLFLAVASSFTFS